MQAQFEYTLEDWREFQQSFRRRSLGMLWPLFAVVALFMLVLLLLPAVTDTAPAAGTTPPAPATGISLLGLILPLVPWFLLLGAAFLSFTFIRRRQGPRAMLTQTPALRGPIVADVDAAGLTMQGRLYRSQYRWEAVIRFQETRNLFLLFVNPTTAMMLPKRAFATQQELDAMRALGRLAGQPVPGFPVVPASPPPLLDAAVSAPVAPAAAQPRGTA